MKRFEQSDGLDTALYVNLHVYFCVCDVSVSNFVYGYSRIYSFFFCFLSVLIRSFDIQLNDCLWTFCVKCNHYHRNF